MVGLHDADLAVLLEVPGQVDDLLRAVLHVDDEPVDAGHEEVVADVHGNGDHEARGRRQQRDLDPARDQRRLHGPGCFDRGEGQDHAGDRPQEAHQRSDVGDRRQNDQAALEEAELDGAGRRDGGLELPGAERSPLDPAKPHEQDRRRGSGRVVGDPGRPVDVTAQSRLFHLGQNPVRAAVSYPERPRLRDHHAEGDHRAEDERIHHPPAVREERQ